MMTDNLIFGGPTLLPDLDSPTPVYTYVGNEPGDGGGGGLDGMINWDNVYYHASNAIQSNGYIFIDYNRDGHFDQAWYGDGNGGWFTSGGGDEWRRDNGPADELLAAAEKDNQA